MHLKTSNWHGDTGVLGLKLNLHTYFITQICICPTPEKYTTKTYKYQHNSHLILNLEHHGVLIFKRYIQKSKKQIIVLHVLMNVLCTYYIDTSFYLWATHKK
jgi:hypothetical protein